MEYTPEWTMWGAKAAAVVPHRDRPASLPSSRHGGWAGLFLHQRRLHLVSHTGRVNLVRSEMMIVSQYLLVSNTLSIIIWEVRSGL